MNRFITTLALLLPALAPAAGAQVNPCSLLTRAEIENALGVKVSGLDGSGEIKGMYTCGGVAAKRLQVMLMFAPGKAGDPNWPIRWVSWSANHAKAPTALRRRWKSRDSAHRFSAPRSFRRSQVLTAPSAWWSRNQPAWPRSAYWSQTSKTWFPSINSVRWWRKWGDVFSSGCC